MMNLFIRNLDFKATKSDLQNLFAKYKADSVVISTDRETGKSKGFGFVTIADDAMANRAIAECNGEILNGRAISVSIAREKPQSGTHGGRHVTENATRTTSAENNQVSPYNFFNRQPNKVAITAFHNELSNKRYDIAFDITWETRAATALNPCTIVFDPETKKAVPDNYPKTSKDSEYAGYNKRWLMLDRRLAISPFTVKSAIANGFANLLGGCYRVEQFALKPTDGHFKKHEDTVPAGSRLCEDMSDNICPRCRMFGMTDQSGKEEMTAIGFKGRFKSSALISAIKLNEEMFNAEVPFIYNDGGASKKFTSVPLSKWLDNNDDVCSQYFLPIQGEPKANRSDKDGYFNLSSGHIKGAKYYHHGNLTMQKLIKLIEETNKKTELNKKNNDFEYSHRLRNYAQVCKEGISFIGTVGAENCSADEIAALIMLLDSRIADHGFKVGLGKALGMGSIHSAINKVWIRKTDNYERWEQVTNFEKSDELIKRITIHVADFGQILLHLVETGKRLNAINALSGMQERPLVYPRIGNQYWRNFNAKLFPRI